MENIFVWILILFLFIGAIVFSWLIYRVTRSRAQLKRTLDVVMLQVTLPKDSEDEKEKQRTNEEDQNQIGVAEQWLATLSNLPTGGLERLIYGRPVIVLEIVARPDGLIVWQVGTERKYINHLEKQVYSLYPEANVEVAPSYTIFQPGDTVRSATVKLRGKSHLPIATYRELTVDPLQSLTGSLARLAEGDAAVIQLICRVSSPKTQRKGRVAAKRTMQGLQGDVRGSTAIQSTRNTLKSEEFRDKSEARAQRLTPRSQERVELVETKSQQKQFEVNLRLAVATKNEVVAEQVIDGLGGAFAQYNLPDLNGLMVKRTTKPKSFLKNLVWRIPSDQAKSVLSAGEVASLWHFPLVSTETPNILWRGAKVTPVPPGLPRDGVLLGNNSFRGVDTPVYLPDVDRRRHLYLIGQTGTGKTTLFLNMIIQDITAGHGVGVIDPHGDLIEDILLHIPPERTQDVILFDPRDTERPLGFNILETTDEGQKDLVVNEVVQILQKLAARLNPESVGPMFEHYLRNALLALGEDHEATLIDVPRMFVDQAFREKVLSKVDNPTVKQFWEQEFAQSQRGQMSADMLSYVISKLGRFVSNKTMRNIIGQARSSFDVRQVMDERKILLCNLSKGSLGDINSDLLGFVLVSKLQIAALGRANVSEDMRPDFYLYLDEFQNFTTDSISTILSEARKYRLNLNLTHQFIQQLDDPIKEAVFGNVGSVVSYRVGVDDTELLARQFDPVFSEYDLVNLERFTMCARLLVNGTPQRSFSLKALPPPAQGDVMNRDSIKSRSRESYGRDVNVVEQEVIERFKYGNSNDSEDKKGGSADYMSESLFDVN